MARLRLGPATAATALLLIATAPPLLAQTMGPVERFEVHEVGIAELGEALASGRTTSVELVDAYLARIHAYDADGPALNAVIRRNPAARADAAALDRERRQRGPRGPLHGIPVLVKDNYEVAGLATSGGSLALAGWVPRDDAALVERLRSAGAVILGMTNMHELASGITTITALGDQTRNPYDPARNPGGSSGGTGAAVAASFAALGWGSDTCGSIRIPAAHQNLFGLRPSSGMFSLDGIIPLSHTQDVPGPLARSVTDLALGLDATTGPESSVPDGAGGTRAPRFRDALDPSALRGARLGLLTNYFGDDSQEVEPARIVRAALDSMEVLGAEVVELSIPRLDSLIAGSSTIPWDFKWDLIDFLAERPDAPIRSIRDILDRGLYHQVMESNFRARDTISGRDTEGYRKTLAKQDDLRAAVLETLEGHDLDALVYPTVRRKPAPIGEGQSGTTCQLSAGTGYPAITMPAGFTRDGLPIGIELLGPPRTDERLVALAYAYEQATAPRRAPHTTPPLVLGLAPEPVSFLVQAVGLDGARVTARFVHDAARGTLDWTATVAGVDPAAVHAVTLDLMEGERRRAIARRLLGPGVAEGSGTLRLTPADREALEQGRWALNLYTGAMPSGATPATLAPR